MDQNNGFDDHRFIYEVVEEQLTANIVNGVWPEATKLKDEPSLAKELSISRGTLRKVIKSMIEKGFLIQLKGKGTFVTSSAKCPQPSRFVSYAEALIAKGIPFETKVVEKAIVKAGSKVASVLNIDLDSEVFFLERVRFIGNTPATYLKDYLVPSDCPNIMQCDFEKQTLFSALEKEYSHKIVWGKRTTKAMLAVGDIAHYLSVNVGAPVLYQEEITYTLGNRPFVYCDAWLNTDKYEMIAIIPR